MNQALFDFVAGRRSTRPKYLAEPAPGADDLKQAVRAACSAPDHGSLRPWRFVSVAQDRRPALADLFEAAARRLGADDERALRTRSKALKGPGLVAFVVCLKDGIAADDQMLTAGAALENFLLALEAMGYGGIVLSGSVLEDAQLQANFCKAPGEKLVCWITVGTLTKAHEARPEPETLPLSDW